MRCDSNAVTRQSYTYAESARSIKELKRAENRARGTPLQGSEAVDPSCPAPRGPLADCLCRRTGYDAGGAATALSQWTRGCVAVSQRGLSLESRSSIAIQSRILRSGIFVSL